MQPDNRQSRASRGGGALRAVFSRSFDTWTSKSSRDDTATTNTAGPNQCQQEKEQQQQQHQQQKQKLFPPSSSHTTAFSSTSFAESFGVQQQQLLLGPHDETTDDGNNNIIMLHQHQHHNNEDEKKSESSSPHQRRRLRDIEHSWDSDANFSAFEIQRIKKKTHHLRHKRHHHMYGTSSSNTIFRETGFEEGGAFQQQAVVVANTTGTSNTSGGGGGQSVRSRARHQRNTWGNTITTTTSTMSSNNKEESSTSSLGQVLDHRTVSGSGASGTTDADTGTTETAAAAAASSGSNNAPLPNSTSAAKARRALLQNFHKPRELDIVSSSSEQGNNTTEELNTTDETADDDDDPSSNLLTLHDLCGEAATTDDIAWRNALYLLAVQPQLASVIDKDSTNWTALHICCLGMSPPPDYMVRALLYIYPRAASMVDDGGRLPLHLCAASSAHDEIMQMLVEEYPAAIYIRDDHGLTPLHLILRNCSIELTLPKVKILLGMTIVVPSAQQQQQQQQQSLSWLLNSQFATTRHTIRQRRGEHLDLDGVQVEEWRRSLKQRSSVVTNLNHNELAHEAHFVSYPNDVQVSLRKLSQWKHRQRSNGDNDESVEVQLSLSSNNNNNNSSETNPAAIRCGSQMPIHMLVQRAVIDQATLDISAVEGSYVFDEQKKGSYDDEEKKEDDDEEESEDQEVSSTSERLSVPHAASVLRLLAAACPEALVVRDANGLTPLLQVMQLRDSLPSFDIVEILLGRRAAGYESLPSWATDLPVHCLKGTSKYINPAMLGVMETGQLPLHIAAEEMSADYSLIEAIHESYPGAIHVQDGRGRTPLHLALRSYRRIPADPQVIELLFSEQVAQITDDYGNLPFDLLLEGAKSLPSEKPRPTARSIESDSNASTVYQRFFNASILGAAKPDTPTKLSSFLRRLRDLPPWLRSEACATSFVQDMLTEELATPWKCALILFDGLLLIILITVFRLQMSEFVDQLDTADLLSSWYTYSVYATAIFRLFGQVIMGGVAVSLGEFGHLCLFNVWYWIDLLAMLFSIITSVCLYGATSDERLLVLGTIATCLLWLSLIGYLSNWWYGMAVFSGGFAKIAYYIVCPFVAAGALIICFAQCFYTLLQLECSEAIGGSPACSLRDAFRIVYMLLRGEPLVDPTGTLQFSAEAAFLVAIFLFVFTLFLIALLVSILISSSGLSFEEIALESYWEPKLAFILSAGDFGVSLDDRPSRHDIFTKQQEQVWDTFMIALSFRHLAKGEKWYAATMKSNVLTWLVALFAVPVWIILGLCSLGLLWPPQIRRWIFRPCLITRKQRNRQVAKEQSIPQISDIRSEIMQMKLMSYERTNEVEKELRDLKEMLQLAMEES